LPADLNPSAAALDEIERTLEAELRRLVAGDPGRSVAVRTLDGPLVQADIGGDTPRSAGSFVKVLLAVALYEQAGRGAVDLDQPVLRRELKGTMYPPSWRRSRTSGS
jgi:beta-lactamase class A